MFSMGSNKDEGVSGSKNNLEYQWAVGKSSVLAHSRAVSMRKRIYVPRRLIYCFCKIEVAWGRL